MTSIYSNLAIIIPAYNEASTLQQVISTVSVYGIPIVVDDGSSDHTKPIAIDCGAIVVSFQQNLGYDNAIAAGIEKAIEQKFDYAITFDADGQHKASKIKEIFEKLETSSDLVIGVRTRFQRPAEFIFANLSKLLWDISDPLSGMKGYRLSKLKPLPFLKSYNSIGTELSIRAVRSGWKVDEVFIDTSPRPNSSRFGSGFYPNLRILKAMILGLLLAKST